MPTCSAPDAVRDIKGGKTVVIGNSRFDIVTEAELKAQVGDAAPDAAGRKAYMAGLTFRTTSLAKAAAALKAGKIPVHRERGPHRRAGEGGGERGDRVHRIGHGIFRLLRLELFARAGEIPEGRKGFSGSAVQIGWMQGGGPSTLPRNVGVVLVHGLNPYGFAHSTRTTENNVDLNRNFIDRDAGAAPANPHYETLHDELKIRDWTDAENARVDKAMAAFTEKHGRDALFDTLARGQYAHPDGLMFGGADREWSNRTLEAIVQEFLTGAEKVAFIDWHTGIGDYGKPFFLCFNDAGSAAFPARLRLVGQGECRRRAAARHGAAELHRPGLQRRAALPRQSRDVRRGDRVRHARHRHAPRAAARPVARAARTSLDSDVRTGLQADMMDAFCPFDGQWRKDTLDSGLKLTDQAIKGLAAW